MRKLSTLLLAAVFACSHGDDAFDVDIGDLGTTDAPSANDTDLISDTLPSFIDRGLIARYLLNESSAGTDVEAVLDNAPLPQHLAVIYDNENDSYIEHDGHRGVHFANHANNHALLGKATGTKFQQTLDASTTFTFETVIDIKSNLSTRLSRVLHLGSINQAGIVMIYVSKDSKQIGIQYNNSTWLAEWPIGDDSTGRQVLTFVLDLSNPDATKRILMYRDGSLVPPTGVASIANNSAINFEGTDDNTVTLGNKPNFARGLAATYYYAAFYKDALSQEEVSQNAARLLLDDDTP